MFLQLTGSAAACRYHWVEGAEAFVNIHNETGILGIAGESGKAVHV